ncbi:hypothetical protein BRC91_10915 [Halobacteriales archaeon QS_4_62_28]|nr:MAG: hypothetical protein BRC91_10915 [Halobacteriales archaeon QS_4_62_28]
MTDDTVTVTLQADEESDELTVPTALVDMLRESDESTPQLVGDIAMFGMAQRIHGAVHHAQGEPTAEIQDANETTMDLFEDRFDATFAELTGHDH